MHKTTPYYLAFQKIGLGAGTLRRLQETFPDVQDLWEAPRAELEKTQASKNFLDHFCAARSKVDMSAYAKQVQRPNMKIFGLEDPGYPHLLRETSSPPLVLFLRGNAELLHTRCLTVVGTRTISRYGSEVTRFVIEPIAQSGMTIVSGLAFGIDAAAHEAALSADGRTIAVLGSGVDRITPAGNTYIGKRILEHHGAIISEYPPGMLVQKHHFPQRNRILAGLSAATLVVEAGKKSGALITAKMALEEGREVLAVPGPITQESSAGTNALIQSGAGLVTSAKDLKNALGLDIPPLLNENMRIGAHSDVELTLLSLLREPRHVDELVEHSRLDASIVNATLSLLELSGDVRHLGGMHYLRTH